MTAVTVVEAYDNTLTNEGHIKMAYLQGGPGWTYTPANSSGKTIRVLGAYNETAAGTANVVTTISDGVITVGADGSVGLNDNFTIIYTLT